MEPREFEYAIKGWQREKEETVRLSWEQTRILGTTMVNLQSQKPISVHQYLPMPWDKEAKREPVRIPTQEEIDAMAKRFGVGQTVDDTEADKLKAFKEKLAKQIGPKNDK